MASTHPDAKLVEFLAEARRLLDTDTAAILLLDDSGEFLVATAAQGLEEEVRQGSRVPVGLGFAGRVAKERRPVIIDEVSPATVVNPVLLYKGVRSMLGVPLMVEDRMLGVMHVGTLSPRAFTQADAQVLGRVAQRIAGRLQAQRSRDDARAAAALQRSLAPTQLCEPNGLAMAARYVPGGRAGVGGDWYDCFHLPDGKVGVAVGDVMGHGLHAATVMGRIRSALRAYAMDGDRPDEVLRRLDDFILHFEPGEMVSVFYGLVDPDSGSVELSSAGHVPPVLAWPGAGAHLLEVTGDLVLGVDSGPKRTTHEVAMPPGATLALYTDGLVEGVGQDLSEAIERLCEVLARGRGDVETVCADVMAALVGDVVRDDDVTLLLVQRH